MSASMTREEAIDLLDNLNGMIEDSRNSDYDTAFKMAIKALEQEPCEDAVSREFMYKLGAKCIAVRNENDELVAIASIESLPPVNPQPKTGHWLRMSDLSEQEDDRYKCSRCGNVVHYTNKMNLYTFNSWCGRCGSDNGRR